MTDSIWIRTDERTEALKALEMVVDSLRAARIDPYRWKWAILAMQNAIQALIVTTISGTDGLGALRPDIARKWMEAYESGTDNFPAEMKIDWFPELYDRMKKEFSYAPASAVDDGVTKVNNLRNRFVHFSAQSWSLNPSGLPQMFKDCLAVVSFLIGKAGGIPACEIGLIENLTHAHVEAVKLADEIDSMYHPRGGFF
ncbi:MAG TPA: hypothetical protein VGK27_06875 [Candidatus Deferrimicrobiaceae bacterium]|jgi:hypothetical protein